MIRIFFFVFLLDNGQECVDHLWAFKLAYRIYSTYTSKYRSRILQQILIGVIIEVLL